MGGLTECRPALLLLSWCTCFTRSCGCTSSCLEGVMGRKSHLFYQNDIARSIARNVPVTARCGRKQTITKETWEKSRDALPCRACMNRWAASLDGSTIHNRTPGDKPPRGYVSTYTFTGQVRWTNYEVGPWGA